LSLLILEIKIWLHLQLVFQILNDLIPGYVQARWIAYI